MSKIKNENIKHKEIEKFDDLTIEENDIKCSLKEHNNNNAIIYCQECKIYMCKKCQNLHSGLFTNHHIYNINKKSNDIFTGLCKEKTHSNRLDYYCKSHNQLCCVDCLCIIEDDEKGQHKNCDVCVIKKIKDTKKKLLKENNYLECLSNSLKQSIDQLKRIFEEKNINKEEVKLEIQNNFKELKKILDERENKLLIEVDKKFDDILFKEDFIKQTEELPKKVNDLLNKGKTKDIDWNDINKLNLIINNCIIIENSIKNIKLIDENIIKFKSIFNLKIKYNSDKDKFNKLLDDIKKYGDIFTERQEENNELFNIDYKGFDKKDVEDMYHSLDQEFNLISFIDKDEVIKKII